MKIEVKRYKHGAHDTVGTLYVDGKSICKTLEDEIRDAKVRGETAIPKGEYDIKLRTWGGTHERYKRKFGDFHKGMLWIQDVPNFQYILIHIGNTDDDTDGCILVGTTIAPDGDKHFLGSSTKAYKKLYPMVVNAIEKGERVTIEVK